jgi:hypothetical protein
MPVAMVCSKMARMPFLERRKPSAFARARDRSGNTADPPAPNLTYPICVLRGQAKAGRMLVESASAIYDTSYLRYVVSSIRPGREFQIFSQPWLGPAVHRMGRAIITARELLLMSQVRAGGRGIEADSPVPGAWQPKANLRLPERRGCAHLRMEMMYNPFLTAQAQRA